ncbi:SURF1 family protein [Microlunatus elymi]|uniref:SURF1-like protein n=1 Tax=Microlunatus elymi TaxID=2596828 RepID=A0A516PU95_9ACTN|nr:SURF1 family protein [Microlunatus elymi]QDP94747.1 SURF1 family protein [Microlunatus elymi]
MTVVKQIAVVLGGLLIAAIMVGLGVWQLDVYESQGHSAAVARAAAPPVDVASVAPPGQDVGDAYGRRVRFTGHYDPKLQTYIADPERRGRYRVLTAFRLDSGGALAVVRGVTDGKDAAPPPTGTVTQTGVLLPSEGADAQAAPSSEPTSVVLASLTQSWPIDLVNGYATLGADEARAQSLTPATIELPSSHGRLRNGFYALQWWVFAGFAVVMAIRIARDLGRDGDSVEAFDSDADSDSGGASAAAETEQHSSDTADHRVSGPVRSP